MYEKLLKTVTNLGSPKILVVGDFMLDVYIHGDALRISPEAPVPVLKVTKTDYTFGGAGAVTADLAALGAVPSCLGVIGNDDNGKKLKKILTNSGAETGGLLTIKNRQTICKRRLIGLAQHRHPQQLIRIESICKQMIQLAIQANKKVLIDPSLNSDYSKYSGATLITPNRKEASTCVGFEIKTEEQARRAAQELAEKLRLEAVVITLDKQGAFLKSKNTNEIIPTRARNVYDVTGAGDMVLATLAIALAAGCDYKTAVQLSNTTSGIEVEKFG
ncbi:MAG: bifunctional heptose 7-phosphate kinase/heptose 1-phosphate adenyltransferase, partial [Planctomycetota bacterium]